jgi:hypothetical protein
MAEISRFSSTAAKLFIIGIAFGADRSLAHLKEPYEPNIRRLLDACAQRRSASATESLGNRC